GTHYLTATDVGQLSAVPDHRAAWETFTVEIAPWGPPAAANGAKLRAGDDEHHEAVVRELSREATAAYGEIREMFMAMLRYRQHQVSHHAWNEQLNWPAVRDEDYRYWLGIRDSAYDWRLDVVDGPVTET